MSETVYSYMFRALWAHHQVDLSLLHKTHDNTWSVAYGDLLAIIRVGLKHIGVELFKTYYYEPVIISCICWIIIKNCIIMHGMENIRNESTVAEKRPKN
jgi:hypothetical protein